MNEAVPVRPAEFGETMTVLYGAAWRDTVPVVRIAEHYDIWSRDQEAYWVAHYLRQRKEGTCVR